MPVRKTPQGPDFPERHRPQIVAIECRWADYRSARLRHLPFDIANTDTMDVVHPRSSIGFGLSLNLPSATQEVHIVDVGTTERSLQCLEMVARRHTEHLNLVAIDVEVDRGVRGREPREHLGMTSLGTADFRAGGWHNGLRLLPCF